MLIHKMKKNIQILIILIILGHNVEAQVSYKDNNLTDEQLNEGNTEIINKASTIIDARRLDYKIKSLVKKGEIDKAVLLKITNVLRSNELKQGDTIIVIFRNVGYGTDSFYEQYTHGGYPSIFSQNPQDHSINCELFLIKNLDKIIINDRNWQNKIVYELYLTKNGYASVYINDDAIADKEYDVYALFNLKFKTMQEWYNYLKKYDNIKVPEGY